MNFDDQKIIDLIEDVGTFIEYWGFRKIQGRVWASVYLSEVPLSTPEIVKGLDVSKALVSGSINELLEYGLITKVGQVKYGGHTYMACPNPAEVVRDVIKNRELVLFKKIEKDIKNLSSRPKDEIKKLGVNPIALEHMNTLTTLHKKIATNIAKKNIKSMGDWIRFMKNVARFSF